MRNSGDIPASAVTEFNKKYPNIKVDVIDLDPVKLKALQAAGDPPDIFTVQGPAVPSLIAQGQVKDLTAPLEAVGITGSSTYAVSDLYKVGGKRYGIPINWSPDFNMYVNNAMFKAAGIPIPSTTKALSWQQIASLAKKLTIKNGSATTQLGLGGAWDTFSPARVIQTALAESGQTLYSADGKSMKLTANPKAMDTLEFMANLAKEGVTHSPANPSASYSGDEFSKGQIAMVSYGYWFNSTINNGQSAIGTDYTVLPAPYWTNASRRINPTITGTGYVMSSKTKNPQAAWDFLNWYLVGQPAKDRAVSGAGFPVLKANTSLLPNSSPVDQQVLKVVKADAESSPALKFDQYYDDSVFANSYNKYLQSYISGSMSLAQMGSSIQDDVNSAIQDGVQQVQ
jgi:multiple sugar transport system substrate-binding protein